MNAVSVALTALLGVGGIGGLGVLVKSLSKAERGSTIVATVERGALVLERLNDRLEGDLAAERTARVAAELALSEHMRRCHPAAPSERSREG